MGKTQIAIKVNDDASLRDLNAHLEGGWKCVNMCGMSSSVSTACNSIQTIKVNPTCLVILEGELE